MTPVLLVSPTAKPGGAERLFAGLARSLTTFGLETHAAVLEDGPLVEWLRQSACPTSVRNAGRMRRLRGTVGTIAWLRRLVDTLDAQAVVSNQAKGHIYGGSAALLARVPEVWWQHGVPGHDRFDRVARRVPAAAVVCVSEEAVHVQERLTPRRKVRKVWPGLPVDTIARSRGMGTGVREELGLRGERLVGIVGRLQDGKGQDVFLHAAATVVRDHPDVRFAVVGGAILGWEGAYPDDLRRLADELGLGERVFFAGHREDVYAWFDALDVVVNASLGEGFPLVLLEALALGRPVVATALGGPSELIEDRRSGLLVPPGDADALAAAIDEVLRDRELAARLAHQASLRAQVFSEEAMARRFAAVIRDVLASRSAAATGGSRAETP